MEAEEKGSWQPHWLGLLSHLQGRVPAEWTVIVMSDRGLYAPWLYAKIVSLGWHPFMRINKQGHFRPVEEGTFRSLATAAPSARALLGVEKWTASLDRRVVCGVHCWPVGMRAMKKCG